MEGMERQIGVGYRKTVEGREKRKPRSSLALLQRVICISAPLHPPPPRELEKVKGVWT